MSRGSRRRRRAASEGFGSVSGGCLNVAGTALPPPKLCENNQDASVSGGAANTASDGSWIGAGSGNLASLVGSVSGGEHNHATGDEAAIAGGFRNTASGLMSSVLGGSGNNASGDCQAIPAAPITAGC